MKRSSTKLTLLLVLAALGQTFMANAGMASYQFGPGSGKFSFFPTPTAWDPGPNTARVGGFPDPGGATWSIMPAGMTDPTGSDTDHTGTTSDITALGVSGFALTDYAKTIGDALDVWAAASGFTNLGQVGDGGVDVGAPEASGGHLGDIRVAAWEFTAPTVLAHAYQPGTETEFGPGGTIAGDVHFDVDREWVDEVDDTTGDSDFDLFTVMLHEMGHALGLGHSTVVGSVMEPLYGGSRRTLHADDIAGIIAIYGSLPEPSPFVIWLLLGTFGIAVGRWQRRLQRPCRWPKGTRD